MRSQSTKLVTCGLLATLPLFIYLGVNGSRIRDGYLSGGGIEPLPWNPSELALMVIGLLAWLIAPFFLPTLWRLRSKERHGLTVVVVGYWIAWSLGCPPVLSLVLKAIELVAR